MHAIAVFYQAHPLVCTLATLGLAYALSRQAVSPSAVVLGGRHALCMLRTDSTPLHKSTNDDLDVKVEAFNPSIQRSGRGHRHRARDGVRDISRRSGVPPAAP